MKNSVINHTINELNKRDKEFTYSVKDSTITYCKDYDPYLDDTINELGVKLPTYFLDELSKEMVYHKFDLIFSSLSQDSISLKPHR